MVRRLVEEQRLRMTEEGLRQENPDLLAALKLGHRPLVKLIGNIEALKEDGRVALGAVAVFLPDDALELAEAHAVLVGERGLRVQDFARLEGVPEPAVPHDDRVDHAELVERELVLSQHPDLLRTDHGALLRRQVARQKLHERGLP